MRVILPVPISPDGAGEPGALILADGLALYVDDGAGGHEPFLVSGSGTSVPEDDAPPWSSSASYAAGDRVIAAHQVFECLAPHTDVDPLGPPSTPPKWLRLGMTNRWRLFDGKVGSRTTHPDEIAYSLLPGQPINAIAFLGLEAAVVEVRVIDPNQGIVYQTDAVPTQRDHIRTYWDWFFSPLRTREDIILHGIPATAYAAIQIRILRPGAMAAIGELVLGQMVQIGKAQHGSGVGIRDYSRKEVDPFGNFEIVERGFSKRAEFDVQVETPDVSYVQRTLARYRARPLVWIGALSIEATIIYGYYRDFYIVLSNATISDCSITVEGVTQ